MPGEILLLDSEAPLLDEDLKNQKRQNSQKTKRPVVMVLIFYMFFFSE